MKNLERFIKKHITHRDISLFAPDVEANKETLSKEIKNKKVCVIGGARVNWFFLYQVHSSF